MFLFKKNDTLSAQEQMLKYMNEKYNEDFKPGLCEMANWAYSYDSMTVYSDKFPGEFIQVYRYNEKEFKDNYLAFLFREEVEKKVQEIVESLFGKCVVIMHISNLPVKGNLTKDASLNDYLENASSMNNLYIYLENYDSSKDYKECIKKLQVQFMNNLLPREFNLRFLKKNMLLEEITRESENMILDKVGEESWFVKKAYFCFQEDYKLDESELDQL